MSGLAREEADAQEPRLGLDEYEAGVVSIVSALEHARPFGDGLAVVGPPVPERARAAGGEANALAEGPVAGGQTKTPDAREEFGSGAENSRVSESQPDSDDGVVLGGAKRHGRWGFATGGTARAASLPAPVAQHTRPVTSRAGPQPVRPTSTKFRALPRLHREGRARSDLKAGHLHHTS